MPQPHQQGRDIELPPTHPREPTEEEVNAAAERVIASGRDPTGMSEQQFFDLVDREIQMARPSGEPETYDAGFDASINRDLGRGAQGMAFGGARPTGVTAGEFMADPKGALKRSFDVVTDPANVGEALSTIGLMAIGGKGGQKATNKMVSSGVKLQRAAEKIPSSVPTSSATMSLLRSVAKPATRGAGRILEGGGRILGGEGFPLHEPAQPPRLVKPKPQERSLEDHLNSTLRGMMDEPTPHATMENPGPFPATNISRPLRTPTPPEAPPEPAPATVGGPIEPPPEGTVGPAPSPVTTEPRPPGPWDTNMSAEGEGTGAAQGMSPSPDDALHAAIVERLGMGQPLPENAPTIGAGPVPEPSPTTPTTPPPRPLYRNGEIVPPPDEDTAAQLRNELGARDAGRILGRAPDVVRAVTEGAMTSGTLPTAAQARIDAKLATLTGPALDQYIAAANPVARRYIETKLGTSRTTK